MGALNPTNFDRVVYLLKKLIGGRVDYNSALQFGQASLNARCKMACSISVHGASSLRIGSGVRRGAVVWNFKRRARVDGLVPRSISCFVLVALSYSSLMDHIRSMAPSEDSTINLIAHAIACASATPLVYERTTQALF
eukprot:scaffold4587_cov182-Amphora_coffeaeformis.AAC.17